MVGAFWLLATGVAAAGIPGGGASDSGVRVNLNTGARSSEPQSDVHYNCVADSAGIVRIDGKLGAWRLYECGSIPLTSPPRSCQVNGKLKLWRLYWTDS